jgi:polyhydroxybutyrate depolymerase
MKRYLIISVVLCLTPSVSCSGQSFLQPGAITRHVRVNGVERAYVVNVPLAYDPEKFAPVILGFHGGASTPGFFEEVSHLTERAGPAGFVVVYPEGYKRSWNAGDCCCPAECEGVDDVSFVRAVLDDLASTMRVDPRRIFATGSSNGAMFTYRLACELSDRIAAIAVSAGTMALPNEACNPTRPVPVLHFHGLADEYAPFNGGHSKYEPTGVRRSVPGTIAFWLRRNGCTDEARVSYKQGSATCTTHPDCRSDAEVVLCTIREMGHVWPGYTPKGWLERLLGPGTTDISATDMIVQFFGAHPMPLRN